MLLKVTENTRIYLNLDIKEVINMARSKKPSVHTVPSGKGWKVVQGGKTMSHHNKKSNAQMVGRRQAKTEHRIHNKNGSIGKAHSYENDPHPPNG